MDARAVADIYEGLFVAAPMLRPRTLLEPRHARMADHPSLRLGGVHATQELRFVDDPRPEKNRVLEAVWCTAGGAMLTRVPPLEAKTVCRASVETALVRAAWRVAWETPAADRVGVGERRATDRTLTVWRLSLIHI